MEVWFCPGRVADLQGLTPEVRQRCFARMKQEKFINMEAGAVGSHLAAMDVVRRNALPKLTDKMPNLVVVVDDLIVTPVGLPGIIGSTPAAREAGITEANSAATQSSNVASASLTGSQG